MQQIGATRRWGWLARGLPVIWVIAVALMLIAAVNLEMVFVLFSAQPQAGRPNTGLDNFAVQMVVSAFPFVSTSALIATIGRRSAGMLALISGLGLPFLFFFGFVMGFAASAVELPVNSPSAAALTIYQFTWLAAVLADGLTLVAALFARRAG